MIVSVSPTAPLCTNPQIVKLVEDGIGREGNFGLASRFENTKVHFIDGHREISVDRAADIRHCECVVHTAAGDIQTKYFTKWKNPVTGEAEVGSEM